MRKLARLSSATRERLFLLVVAALLTGCGGSTETAAPIAAASDASSDAQADAPVDASPDGPKPDTNFAYDAPNWNPPPDGGCGDWHAEETHQVQQFGEGVPATASEVCAASPGPVSSNRAARVSLTVYSQTVSLAAGRIDIAPDLLGQIIGVPTIEVVEAQPEYLAKVTFSDIQVSGPGFTFQAKWDTEPYLGYGLTGVTIRVTLRLACGEPGQERIVESLTRLDLCGSEAQPVWMGSGDECTTCYAICEMAPSPIAPAREDDSLPLARALLVDVNVVADFGGVVVLAAHTAEGQPYSYRWVASGGKLTDSDDVAVWAPPADDRASVVQVAVETNDALGVGIWPRR